MSAPRWRYLVFGYVAVLVLVSLLAVGLLFQLTLDNEADRATATAQFATVNAAESAASQAQSLALAGQSQVWLAAGRPAHALAAALAAVEIDPHPAEVQASLAEAAYAPGIRQRIILPELYTSGDLAIAPDGQTVYYGGFGIGAVDVATGEPLPWRLATPGTALFMVISPDGSRLFSQSSGGCQVWDLATQTVLATPEEAVCERANTVRFSPDGQQVFIAALTENPPVIWDIATDRPVAYLPEFLTPLQQAAYLDPAGERLLLGFWDGGVVQVDAQTGAALIQQMLYPGGAIISALAVTPAGEAFVTATADERGTTSGPVQL